MNPTIALLTDFGNSDIFVGVMKGVMRQICPEAVFVDLTHAIPPQNVRQGAFALLNAYRFFPENTIFLAVVDPGVGSTRRPIAVQAGDYTFIAPDNGLPSYVLDELPVTETVELTNADYHLPSVSNTFHGRDIFAPAAAYAAAGVALTNFGLRLDNLMRLPGPRLEIIEGRVSGEVMQIDQFGNITTSIGSLVWASDDGLSFIPRFGEGREQPIPIHAPDAQVICQRETIHGICTSYSDARRGNVLALVGSDGYLEIAVNQGHAAARLDIQVGDRIDLQLGD